MGTELELHTTASTELTYHNSPHFVGSVTLDRTALPLLQVHTLPFDEQGQNTLFLGQQKTVFPILLRSLVPA